MSSVPSLPALGSPKATQHTPPNNGSQPPSKPQHQMKFFEPQLRTYSAIRIVAVIITAGLIIAMIQFATRPLQRFLDCSSDSSSCQSSKRIQTIMSITVSFIIVIVGIVAVGFVLNILGIKLGSILAGAGILGLIIGLGAQSVIKDVVTGILIISENQISEGDYVYITTAKGDDIQGIVKSLSVRLVKLEDDQGSEVFIPSGNILRIANASRSNQIVTVTITTPLGTDVRSITDVLDALVAQLARDSVIGDKLLTQPQVGGVETLSDSSYTTQIQAQVAAGDQWVVGNYIRLQVVQALQNLEIHAPQVFVNIDKLPFVPGVQAADLTASDTHVKASETHVKAKDEAPLVSPLAPPILHPPVKQPVVGVAPPVKQPPKAVKASSGRRASMAGPGLRRASTAGPGLRRAYGIQQVNQTITI